MCVFCCFVLCLLRVCCVFDVLLCVWLLCCVRLCVCFVAVVLVDGVVGVVFVVFCLLSV